MSEDEKYSKAKTALLIGVLVLAILCWATLAFNIWPPKRTVAASPTPTVTVIQREWMAEAKTPNVTLHNLSAQTNKVYLRYFDAGGQMFKECPIELLVGETVEMVEAACPPYAEYTKLEFVSQQPFVVRGGE